MTHNSNETLKASNVEHAIEREASNRIQHTILSVMFPVVVHRGRQRRSADSRLSGARAFGFGKGWADPTRA
eukprot:7855390-Pyramimonas_sp.AAC.1